MTDCAMNQLVSYCVKCFNQERYIGKALESAFAQTYEPLEILICDDCSADRSDEVIKAAIADYQAKGGRHKVRYYRNEKNLGNLGNWQRMCELAEGELLVKADGDDYSSPERTERLVDAWVKDGKRAVYLFSDGWAVDESGCKLWDMNLHPGYCIGAFEAYAQSCCTAFGPTAAELGHEAADDVVYIQRGKMLGKGLHVPERLVYYRQGSGETSCGLNYTRMMTRGFRFMAASFKQAMIDLEYIKDKFEPSKYDEFHSRFVLMVKHHEALLNLWLGKSLAVRISGYKTAVAMGATSKALGSFLLLPKWINKPILNFTFSFNYWRKCFFN